MDKNKIRPPVAGPGMKVETFEDGNARYERMYVKCGKKCSRCLKTSPAFDPERPGHGPYWYRVFNTKGFGKVRRYIGVDLVKK